MDTEICLTRKTSLAKSVMLSVLGFFHSYFLRKSQVFYPGCQRLFMLGYWFRSSQTFSRGFAVRDFGLRPKICRSVADPSIQPHTRKKPLVPKKETKSFVIRRCTFVIAFTPLLLFYRTYGMHWTICMTLEFLHCGEK